MAVVALIERSQSVNSSVKRSLNCSMISGTMIPLSVRCSNDSAVDISSRKQAGPGGNEVVPMRCKVKTEPLTVPIILSDGINFVHEDLEM